MPADELSDYGITWMDDEQIEAFLSAQSVGVLALPTDGAPAMRPMSFWFDGSDRLYIYYILLSESEKAALTSAADAASFLVFSSDTPFTWRSVFLTGTIDPVPESERAAVEDEIDISWRPDAFKRAMESAEIGLYAFEVGERTGLRQSGLPPGFRQGEE